MSWHRHVRLFDIVDDGPWWIAHEHPERPIDDWCVWSWDCDPCMMHLIAADRLDGDRRSENFSVHAGTREITTVTATLVAAREWRAANGLTPL